MFPRSLIVLISVVVIATADSSSSSSSSTGPAFVSSSSSSSTGPAPTNGASSSSSTGAAPTPGGKINQFLMAGFSKNGTEGLVIDKGVMTPLAKTFVDKEFYTVVYFWLLPGAPANQTFTATIKAPPKIEAKWGTKNLPVHMGNESLAELFIRYTMCDMKVGALETTITLPGYDDIKLTWEKECTDNPFVPPKGGEGSNAFEDFVLVVFVLTLVFCVAGCGYNYISRGRSGVEVIPCWSYMEKCVCCKNTRRYSPRMDYDTPIGDDDSYGASYQADL